MPALYLQRLVWLLETVSTAFSGQQTKRGETIKGKYFNKIVQDLRKHHSGEHLDQVLSWVAALHGYLSSPTGGGIPHGTDLEKRIATERGEAKLYCNLIRSYIGYLLEEHRRMNE